MIRDIAAFTIGALGLFHETVVSPVDRPTLVAAFLSLMAAPAFFRQDDKRKP